MLTQTTSKRRGRWRGVAAAAGMLVAAGALAVSAGTAAYADPSGSGTNPACPTAASSTNTSCTYAYTGSEQTFTVPPGVTSVTINAVGAPGRSYGGLATQYDGEPGGYGASVTATVPVPAGTTTLYVEVGAPGADAGNDSSFNGGGLSIAAGGGASDVRTCSMSTCSLFYPSGLAACQAAYVTACSADTRLVVAGGGGGAGAGPGGNAGDNSVTGAGSGVDDSAAPGGDGGFGGPQGDRAPLFDGYAGGFSDSYTVFASGSEATIVAEISVSGVLVNFGAGGGGSGYYGGGAGFTADPASAPGAGGAGSSYWVPGATDTSMTTDSTGVPQVVISYTGQQQSVSFTSTPPSPALAGGSYTPAAASTSGLPVTIGIDSSSTAGACSVDSSGTVSFTGPGSCVIDADQSGNDDYAPATEVQQDIAVQAASTTTVSSSADPSLAGDSVTFSATVSPQPAGITVTPTGTVTFYDGSTALGTAALSGGTATLATSSLPAGGNAISVGYGGDSNFTGSTSAVLTQTVDQAPAFTADTPPLTAGTGTPYSYQFTASGTPAPSFLLDGAPSWLSINAASGVVSGTPPAGTKSFSYSVTATGGAGSVSTGTFTVAVSDQADVTAAVSCPASLTAGQSGTCQLTATNIGPALAVNAAAGAVVASPLTVTGCSDKCSSLLGILGWSLGSLPAGQSVTLTIDVTAKSAGTAIIAAADASVSPDPNLLNNIAGATVKITKS